MTALLQLILLLGAVAPLPAALRHADLGHLFANSVGLWLFGPALRPSRAALAFALGLLGSTLLCPQLVGASGGVVALAAVQLRPPLLLALGAACLVGDACPAHVGGFLAGVLLRAVDSSPPREGR